jgi:hypothetical protein
MTMLIETNVEKYVNDMEKYTSKIKEISPEQSIEILIRTGVLDSEGNPKKQICDGDMCAK